MANYIVDLDKLNTMIDGSLDGSLELCTIRYATIIFTTVYSDILYLNRNESGYRK